MELTKIVSDLLTKVNSPNGAEEDAQRLWLKLYVEVDFITKGSRQ